MESEQDKKLRIQVEEIKARKEREEKARKKAEEEAKKKKEAEDLEKERIRKEEEEKERIRKEEETARLLKEEEERNRKEDEEEKERLRKEDEVRLRKEEEEEKERLRKEEEERQRKEQEEAEERRRAEERAKAEAEEAAIAAAAAAAAEPQSVEFYGGAEPDSGSPTPPSKETEEEGEITQDSPVDLTQKSIDDKLSLRIDTSPVKLAHPSDFPRKLRPAQLDLSSTSKNTSIPAPPHSALATARNIEDLGGVPYPEGVMSLKVELNVNAKDGKFR
jgi:translation initiation factor 4G